MPSNDLISEAERGAWQKRRAAEAGRHIFGVICPTCLLNPTGPACDDCVTETRAWARRRLSRGTPIVVYEHPERFADVS